MVKACHIGLSSSDDDDAAGIGVVFPNRIGNIILSTQKILEAPQQMIAHRSQYGAYAIKEIASIAKIAKKSKLRARQGEGPRLMQVTPLWIFWQFWRFLAIPFDM